MKYKISKTSEVSLEQLEELKEKGIDRICLEEGGNTSTYSIYTFTLIKKKILEYIKNIPQIPADDPDREKKIFTYLYVKMAQNIVYDEQAAKWADLTGYGRDMTRDRVEEASYLAGGLLEGRAMCKGYSTILTNLLSEVGIKANTICGGGRVLADNMPPHAWNQVFLDGKWFNCDITNDADFINAGLKAPFFLKSDAEFGEGDMNRFVKYPPKIPELVHESKESVDDKMQEELILEQQQNIANEKANEVSQEDEKHKHRTFTETIKAFFNMFHKRKKGAEIE
jgi:hypothetical protein